MIHSKQALLVDDSVTTREIVTEILVYSGYKVKIALDGREGLVDLYNRKNLFDLVIAEINIPGTHGPDFIKMTRNEWRHKKTPIIAIADQFEKSSLEACVTAGATDFLLKPFKPSDLMKILKLCSSL